VSLRRFLNRPGLVGRIWRPGYEFAYACLKGLVLLAARPLFLVRRVGPAPDLPPRGVLLCANHTSYLDPAFVQSVLRRRVTFVMTNDFYERAWGRWFFGAVGAIPVGGGRLGRDGLRRAASLLKRGHVVCVFPEGRLSRDGTLGRPLRGVGHLARRAEVPVVPVGIAGAFRAWPRGALRPRTADVRVAFGTRLRWSNASSESVREKERAFAHLVMDRIRDVVRSIPPRPGDRLPGPQASGSTGR
jgi:1-acyl-sn-glycerol-3-phosphate acyltransferase